MSSCKEDVLYMIDRALECKSRLDGCHCQVNDDIVYECDGCRIKQALRVSRACIVQGADELDLLKVRFIGVQEAIIAKLKGIMYPEGNGGDPSEDEAEDA